MYEYEVFIVGFKMGGCRIEMRGEERKKKGKAYKYKCDVRRRRLHLSKPNNTWLLESIEGYTRVGKVSDKENENENEKGHL